MSSKTLVWIVVLLILLGGGYYYYSQKNGAGDSMQSDQMQAGTMTTPEPSKNSSDDQIIDYMVDGLSNDQKATEKASIDSSSQSSAAAAAGLDTNF